MSKLRTLGVAAASVAATLSLTVAGQAVGQSVHHVAQGPVAHKSEVPPPPLHPTSDKQIQNIDQVRTAIKGYYGDTLTTTTDPVTGTTALHTFDPNGAYAKQVTKQLGAAQTFLDSKAPAGAGHKAIVLDVDDTSLNTYNYEIYSNFAYNPTTNAAFVNAEAFPAVPGMAQLANDAIAKGYTVFYLTGRPESQRAATEGNLTKVGFPVTDADVYLKDLTKPIYSSCYQPPTSTCSTIQYKSLTRQYIESQGYKIVGNFGDQKSDLKGGHAQRKFKLPNPMYYLP